MIYLREKVVRKFIQILLPFIDVLLFLPILASSFVMKIFRRLGAGRLPKSKFALLLMGVYPIRDHYYEPLFHPRHLKHSLDQVRDLPGINLNDEVQLEILEKINYSTEICHIWDTPALPPKFYIHNRSFESGDAEYWYGVIRHFKPTIIIEIGSGQSTIIARQAIERNKSENSDYSCRHICIEPYEATWLESIGVEVMRMRVEDVDPGFFNSLSRNDLLFIDSSHVIRPQGDVIVEFLQILPRLASGVVVHVHDIYTPRDYPNYFIKENIFFWNEQYLLEAFLTQNDKWEVISALNYLHHNHGLKLRKACPYLEDSREPGSFYIRRL